MIISDNDTRWNSIYLFIKKALTPKAKIRVSFKNHKDKLNKDFITLNN
jgi:hypothetical protein